MRIRNKRLLIFLLICIILNSACTSRQNFPGKYPLILFTFDFLLVLLCAIFITAILKLPNVITKFISLYLLMFANIVLVVEIGSLFSLLNSQKFFLIIHMIFTGISFIIWHLKGKPPLINNINQKKKDYFLQKIIYFLKQFPDISLLLIATIIAYISLIIFNLAFPQSIDDVMTTYLARVGFWLQHGNLSPWPADTYQLSQIICPINAQAQIFWSVLFLNSDILAPFSQLLALLLAFAAIYGLCQLLGCSRAWSLLTALIFFSFPNVFFQGTRALTDLLNSSLVASALYLLFYGLQIRNRKLLALSDIALALAIGTKQTVLFAIPGLFIACILLSITKKRSALKLLIYWLIGLLLALVFVGTFAYIQNFYNFSGLLGFLGPAQKFQGFTGRTGFNLIDSLQGMLDNFKYSFAHKDKITFNAHSLSNVWPGSLFFVLVIPGVFYGISSFLKIRNRIVAVGLLLVSTGYIMTLSFVRGFSSAFSRYMLLYMILLLPLTSISLNRLSKFSKKPFNRISDSQKNE